MLVMKPRAIVNYVVSHHDREGWTAISDVIVGHFTLHPCSSHAKHIALQFEQLYPP